MENADEVAQVATPTSPALVTLRAGAMRNHMVVVYGRRPGGFISVFNPASTDASFGGVQMMSLDDFRARYTGSAIVLMPRGSFRHGQTN